MISGHSAPVIIAFVSSEKVLSGSLANILFHSIKTGKVTFRVDDAHGGGGVRDLKQILGGTGFVSCSNGPIDNLKVWNPSLVVGPDIGGTRWLC